MFKNLKLGMKLGLGFGVILVLTAVVAVMGYRGLVGVNDRVDKADDVNRIVRFILEARAQEKNYILRNEPKYVEQHAVVIQKIDQQITVTKDKFNQKLNHDQMDDVRREVEIYNKAFLQYVDLNKQRGETMERMRAQARIALQEAENIRADQKMQLKEIRQRSEFSGAGAGISADFAAGAVQKEDTQALIDDKLIKADDANRLVKWFVDARKNEKEVIISGAEKFKNANQEAITNILVLAEDMKSRFKKQKNIDQVDKFIAAVSGYESEFATYKGLMDKQTVAEHEMVETARNADDTCRAARADQKAKMLNEIASANMMIIGGTGVALILGVSQQSS